MATVWLSLNDLGQMVKSAWAVATRKKEPPPVEDFNTVGEVVDYHLTGRRPGASNPARGGSVIYEEHPEVDAESSDAGEWGRNGWGRNGW